MRIGIIGAGHIGGTLVRRLTQLGHEVAVANSRGPETLRDLAGETGAIASTLKEAVRGSDLVVITIPLGRVSSLPNDLFSQASADVVIVDTGNYYPNGNPSYGREADGFIKAIEAGMAESRWVEGELGRPVVKAFNTILADDLMSRGRPKGDPDRVALPIAGDREADKERVTALLDQLGFDVIDVGTLDDSWRHQPGTPVYVQNLRAAELRSGLDQASPMRSPEWRASR